MNDMETEMDEKAFSEFRRKIRELQLLSASTEKLLRSLRFSGRLSVVVKDGCVLKSGYEEGYFTRRQDQREVYRTSAGQGAARAIFICTHRGRLLRALPPSVLCLTK